MILVQLGLILLLLLAFFDLKSAVGLYIAYIILVPIGSPLVMNLFGLILLAGAIWKYKIITTRKFDFLPVKPALILLVVLACMIPFQSGVPFEFQIENWMNDLMRIIVPPVVLWMVAKHEQGSIIHIRKFFLASCGIATLYGMVLTQLRGINPYLMYILGSVGAEFDRDYASAIGEGRLFGRIQSTFIHPMTWGIFLALSAVLLYAIYSKRKSRLALFLLLLVLCNSVVSGVRTVLLVEGVAFAFLFLRRISLSHLLKAAPLIALLFAIVSFSAPLRDYVLSIGGGGNVSGSSLEMRMEQFSGALEEMNGGELLGHGYKWTVYYQKTWGDHPVMMAFESLVYFVICNNGYLGVVAWSVFLVMLMALPAKVLTVRKDIRIAQGFILSYFLYSTVTGEYNYLPMTTLLMSLLLAELSFSRTQSALATP